MESGGLFVMVTVVLVKLKLMWLVTSWALPQPRDMELWTPWGKCMSVMIINHFSAVTGYIILSMHVV